jgi:hypothetical protein
MKQELEPQPKSQNSQEAELVVSTRITSLTELKKAQIIKYRYTFDNIDEYLQSNNEKTRETTAEYHQWHYAKVMEDPKTSSYRSGVTYNHVSVNHEVIKGIHSSRIIRDEDITPNALTVARNHMEIWTTTPDEIKDKTFSYEF